MLAKIPIRNVIWAAIAFLALVALPAAAISAEAVSAIANVLMALVAVAAVFVAAATIDRQQAEALKQRQMDTLRRLDDEYDAIRFDIHKLYREMEADRAQQGEARAITRVDQEYFYRRFFISLENCFRCYRMGLVAKNEFTNWTSSQITRFATQQMIVLAPSSSQLSFYEAWGEHKGFSFGDKRFFNQYIDGIWSVARSDRWDKIRARTKQDHPYAIRPDLTERELSELGQDAQRIVDQIQLESE